MAATPVKMCTKADIFWKFLLESPYLCYIYSKDPYSFHGTSVNDLYEIGRHFGGVVKDGDVEFSLFNEQCPTYAAINKSNMLAVKVKKASTGEVREFTFDGQYLPLVQCLMQYTYSDGSVINYHQNNLVSLDSVVRIYTPRRIVINFKNVSIDTAMAYNVTAGPDDMYYDPVTGDGRLVKIPPVRVSSTQLVYSIYDSIETITPGYFSFELNIDDTIVTTFAHNREYEIKSAYKNLIYDEGEYEIENYDYAIREGYTPVDKNGYVYLVDSDNSQSLKISINIKYVISDAVFDISAVQFDRKYIRFTTNGNVNIDARIVQHDCLQNPEYEPITKFTTKSVVRGSMKSGRVQMPWGNRFYMIFDVTWDPSKYTFRDVYMRRKVNSTDPEYDTI